MKARICGICLKSGLLCRSCNEKVANGDVSEAEVKVAGLLLRLSGEKKTLRDVRISKVSDSPDMAVILCARGDAAKIIGGGGSTVKKLEKELKKRVMIAEEAEDMKEFVQNLVSPLPVASVSTVYKQGKEILKVVTKGRGPRISSKDFSKVMQALYGKDAELASE